MHKFPLILLICAAWLNGASFNSAAEEASPSGLAFDKKTGTLYVTERGTCRLVTVNAASLEIGERVELPEAPAGISLSADGSTAFVPAGGTDGKLLIVDIGSKEIRSIPVGHTPEAAVVHPHRNEIYVCNRFDHEVAVIESGAGVKAKIRVSREPVAAVLSKSGRFLFVLNQLPTMPAASEQVAAVISVIDLEQRKTVKEIQLPDGSTGCRAICLSPDGKYLYLTHVLSRHRVPTSQMDRAWIVTNGLSIIDAQEHQWLTTVLLDEVDSGAANPWGVAATDDGDWLVIAHAGIHALTMVDRAKMHDRLAKVAAGQKVTDVASNLRDVPNDLSFMHGLMKRVPLTGNGPRACLAVGERVYVAEYFSGSVAVVSLPAAQVSNLALAPRQELSQSRRGEMLFHDAQHCFQQWLSCSSCHPNEARPDGLNWDLMLDGVGNAKNTKSLLLAHQTPPTTHTGSRPNAEASVRAGFRFIEFAVRPEADAQAVDAYLKSLRPVPSPRLAGGELNERAKKGEIHFRKAGCVKCHEPPLYTDLQRHEIGTGKGREAQTAFDTPTLIEIWRTAPYLHDGRAQTVNEVLTKFNPEHRHGQANKLTPEELEELIEFVLSL